MATLMTQYERSRGVITSSILFLFWLSKSTCDVIPLYTKIMLEVNNFKCKHVQFQLKCDGNIPTAIFF